MCHCKLSYHWLVSTGADTLDKISLHIYDKQFDLWKQMELFASLLLHQGSWLHDISKQEPETDSTSALQSHLPKWLQGKFN